MKSRIMPTDQYKISMEARPLRVLYSKYNPNEINSPLQIVRPLGRIRKDKRALLSSDVLGERRAASRAEPRDTTTRLERLEQPCNTDEDKMRPEHRSGQDNPRTSNNNASRLESFRETENTSPVAGRSRSQDFEHKYKLVAARRSGYESPPPMPPTRAYTSLSKKVIHLPLFRVNLKTYSGDTEVSQTVAQTRESLRRLMEIHRYKMKPATLTTANIRNYEFSAPNLAVPRSASSAKITTATMQPFPAKPMLRSSRTRDKLTKQTSFVHKRTHMFNNSDNSGSSRLLSPSQSPDKEDQEGRFRRHRSSEDDPETPTGQDDSIWSLAIRPDTSLTLGSTMNHIDRVIRSPTAEELRELSEVFKGSDSPPGWPTLDEMHRIRSRSQLTRRSKTSLSRPGTVFNDQRPGTVLNNVPESPEEVWTTLRNDEAYASPTSTGSYGNQKPVLRYTSKQSQFKLDPIIVPSHTCTECAMCNLYQRDLETTCPPNSPTSTQCPDAMFFGQDHHVTKTASGRIRSTPKPEVMHISRINVNDGIYVSDEAPILDYMKARV